MRVFSPFSGVSSPLSWRAATANVPFTPCLKASAAAVPARRLAAAVLLGSYPALSSCPRSPPLSFASRRCPPITARRLATAPLPAPAAAATSHLSDRRQWNPGIGNEIEDWELISPQRNPIQEQPLMVCNISCCRNKQGDDCWYYAREIESTVKSGLWVMKNLKDAGTSNPSPPSKKLKKWNWTRIQKVFTRFTCLVFDFYGGCYFCSFSGVLMVCQICLVVLEPPS